MFSLYRVFHIQTDVGRLFHPFPVISFLILGLRKIPCCCCGSRKKKVFPGGWTVFFKLWTHSKDVFALGPCEALGAFCVLPSFELLGFLGSSQKVGICGPSKKDMANLQVLKHVSKSFKAIQKPQKCDQPPRRCVCCQETQGILRGFTFE